MCTAISYRNGAHYFGRNLDLEYSYDESVTLTPRNYSFVFRRMPRIDTHYAMIGVANRQNDYPLYYDATNEMGLSMAALSFREFAKYGEERNNADNIAPFELIPWVLSQCKSIQETKKLLERLNIADIRFSDELPLTPLHWIISDKGKSLVVESTAEGMKIFEDKIGVLTNSPPYNYQLMNLNNYMGISNKPVQNVFSEKTSMNDYSNGMGGIGLPGDYSSMSRFVKAAFVKLNSKCGMSEEENVSQFFHMLGSVAHPRGSVDLGKGEYEITVYSSCCSTEKGIYYYTTYNNSSISAVDMHREELESDTLISYPLIEKQQIYLQN